MIAGPGTRGLTASTGITSSTPASTRTGSAGTQEMRKI
jgi:hypothetical protein